VRLRGEEGWDSARARGWTDARREDEAVALGRREGDGLASERDGGGVEGCVRDARRALSRSTFRDGDDIYRRHLVAMQVSSSSRRPPSLDGKARVAPYVAALSI